MSAEGFGAHLRAARLAAGLSQGGLAARSGLPKPRLSRYENDHILPSLPTLVRLAGALGTTRADLLGERSTVNGGAMLEDALREIGVTIADAEEARVAAQAAKDALVARRGGLS